MVWEMLQSGLNEKNLKATKEIFTHSRNLHGMIRKSKPARSEVNLQYVPIDIVLFCHIHDTLLAASIVSHYPFVVRKHLLTTFHAQSMNHRKKQRGNGGRGQATSHNDPSGDSRWRRDRGKWQLEKGGEKAGEEATISCC